MLTAIARRHARLFARSNDEPERIAADAVARAWAGRDRYDERRGSVEEWLFGVVRNVAREVRRETARQIGLRERLRRRQPAVRTDHTERAELFEAFAKLSERDQLVLYLRYWCDLPHTEIAKRLRMQPDAVRQAVRRAVLHLGRALR
jgi:RNA polymerase sigma factor (sigma-70 family)